MFLEEAQADRTGILKLQDAVAQQLRLALPILEPLHCKRL